VRWCQSATDSTTYEIPIREIIAAVARNARWSVDASTGRQNQVAEAGNPLTSGLQQLAQFIQILSAGIADDEIAQTILTPAAYGE